MARSHGSTATCTRRGAPCPVLRRTSVPTPATGTRREASESTAAHERHGGHDHLHAGQTDGAPRVCPVQSARPLVAPLAVARKPSDCCYPRMTRLTSQGNAPAKLAAATCQVWLP